MTKHLGRYELKEELGHGGMAVVSRAWDPQINRHLAVKVLRPERCGDPDYRSRFLREAKAAGALSHPNIVTIFDVGESDDQPYIAMELLNGTPLDQLIRSGHRFSLDDILQILIQLARALDYAHQNGIVHRDIKPSNIIYFPGSEPRIRITDFGIAHVDDASLTQQTQVGDVLGTPQYMSPEQVLGQSVDGRSDLFSAGVILYELLTGSKPFQGDTIATLMFRIATEEPGPLQSERYVVPPSLKAIVSRLLHKDPDKRYASGAELALALQDLLTPAAAEKPAAPPREPRPRSLRLWWPLLAGLALMLIYTPAAWWVYQQQVTRAWQDSMDNGAQLIRVLRRETAAPVLSQDWMMLDIMAADLIQDPGIRYLLLADHQHRIQAGSPRAQPETTISEPPAGKHDMDDIRISNGDYNGVHGLHFFSPIRFDNKVVGYVAMGIPTQSLQDRERELQITGVALGMALLITVMLSSLAFASSSTRALRELHAGLKELIRGNVNHRLTRPRRGPAGPVYREFNRLAAWLRDQGRNGGDRK